MPRFLGIAVQTDVRCASGSTVAFFRPEDLAECVAVLSPTEPESLTLAVRRSADGAAQLVHGRVVRTCFEDATADREWDLHEAVDGSTDDVLRFTALPIGLRLAGVPYVAADAVTGAPVMDFTAEALTPTEWLTDFVLPALTAAGLSWIAIGTVDATNRFSLAGAWASALEIVRAVADPGRANAEWQLRRNGDTDYKLDLRTAINGSAATLRLHSTTNLLANRRTRSLADVATRVIPRGADASTARTMADHLWRIASVVSGTVLELEDIEGGDGPIAYDDQLNGLYLAALNDPTFASQEVTDSVASSQRVTVADTTGMGAGDWVRLFKGSGENGARVTSLTNPAKAVAPSSGGYGDRAVILDRPEIRGDCNLVPNPWMRDYASASDAPDGWTDTAGTPASRTVAREETIVRDAPYTCRFTTTGTTTLSLETPDIPVWAIDGRRHFAALWFNVQAVPAALDSAIVFELVTDAGALIQEIGRWVRGDDPELDTWLRVEPNVVDLSAITTPVRIRARVGTSSSTTAAAGWDVVFGPALLAESEVPVADIEHSGATKLWQAANAALIERSTVIAGYDVRLVDLEAAEPDAFGDLEVLPGQPVTVVDTELGETVTQRVLEMRPDYLRPGETTVRLGVTPTKAASTLEPGGLDDPDAAPEVGEQATLTVREAWDDENWYVRVAGGPEITVAVDGSAPAAVAPGSYTIERPPENSETQVREYVATGPVGPPVKVKVYVLPRLVPPSAAPAITAVSITNVFAPGDGGGEFDLGITVQNEPTGATYDYFAEVLSGPSISSGSTSDTGLDLADFPVADIEGCALAPGAQLRVRVDMYDGATKVHSKTVTVTAS